MPLISGSDELKQIQADGKRKEAFLRSGWALPNDILWHDTLTHVFRRMAPLAFGQVRYNWSAQV